jgi:drug/metabolite transporter (DMT)-like permease
MGSGITLCFLGALSFGLLGSASKAAERRNCNASVIVLSACGWAALFMLLRTLSLGNGFALSARVVWVAIPFGICAAVAFLAFQKSIAIGKVAAGWLVMNLSAGVPALVSMWVYKERLTWLKCSAFALALVSLWFLFKGAGIERADAKETPRNRGTWSGAWPLLMLIILATNGMSAFGLKVIVAWGLSKTVTFPYLTVWYAAGFLCVGALLLFARTKARWQDLGWGAVIAALSIGGQVAMGMALDSGVPGNIVFPVTMGGSLLVVVLAGRWIFGERMSSLSTSGVLLGSLAVVILSLS